MGFVSAFSKRSALVGLRPGNRQAAVCRLGICNHRRQALTHQKPREPPQATPGVRTYTNMRNKRRVAIALYHRGRLSLGDERTRLGYEAYHWGILIMSKHGISNKKLDCDAYDATDMAVNNPETRENLNPSHDWFFRSQRRIDPSGTGRMIGRIIVGKLPDGDCDSDDGIETLLRDKVPLPIKDASPPQSCVTWTLGALSVLQAAGLAWEFDVGRFQDWALAYGDQCMANLGSDNICEYPGRLPGAAHFCLGCL